jgi:hypothetical protein
MPRKTIDYEQASPYLQYWAAHFVVKYPNRFEYWELVNAVWVDPCYHARVRKDHHSISRITFSCMSNYIDTIIRPRRITKTYIQCSFGHIEMTKDSDVVEASVDIFMENNDL